MQPPISSKAEKSQHDERLRMSGSSLQCGAEWCRVAHDRNPELSTPPTAPASLLWGHKQFPTHSRVNTTTSHNTPATHDKRHDSERCHH